MATPKTVLLKPTEVITAVPWNSRRDYPDRDIPDDPGQPLSTSQLEATIARHGVLQPPPVTRLQQGEHKGRWAVVFGSRRVEAAQRVAPDTPIRFPIWQGNGKSDRTDVRLANLIENLHRESLAPWEQAESLWQIKQSTKWSVNRIAKETGLSKSHVANLVRMKEKAHPVIWEQFQKWGTSLRIPYRTVLTIVTDHKKDEQLEAWNIALKELRSKSGKRGKEKRPGPAKLGKMYAAVDGLKGESATFRRGLKLGLGVALGKDKWPY